MKSEIDLKKYHFFNLPQPRTKKDYQNACDLTVNQLKQYPEVKSVYLSGSRWQLGISDIDILAIFHDQPIKDIDKFAPWDLPEKAKFFFTHSYGKYNQQFFENLSYAVTDKNQERLKLLYGQPISLHSPIQELNQNDYQFLNAVIIFDFLINKLLIYPKVLWLQKIDVRRQLVLLHSLTYTLEVAEVLNHRKFGQDFISDIKNLRGDWFNQNQPDNLKELIRLSVQGIELILEIVRELTDFVEKKSLSQNKDLIFKNRQYYIVFDPAWHQEKFLDWFKKGYLCFRNPFSGQLRENFKLILPVPLSYFLIAYAEANGTFSQLVRQHSKNYQSINLSLNQGVSKHIQALNQLVKDSIKQNGLLNTPFPYGFLLKKQGLVSQLGDWLMLFLRLFKR